MLNRIDVTEPPNSAPQYMLDSRMIAETGCMPKVSGSNSDTPFGAPRPGSTPTRMPSSTPITISARCGSVIAMVKPCSSRSIFSIAAPSETERGGERTVRQRHQEQALEHDVEHDRRYGCDDERIKQRLMFRQRQYRQHIAGGSQIEADHRANSDKDRGRNEQRRQAVQVGARDHHGSPRQRAASEIVKAAENDDDPGKETKRAGIDTRRGPADALVDAHAGDP